VQFTDQVAYIHPRIDGKIVGYFDWLGAAEYVAPRRGAAMHGKRFMLDRTLAGIDDKNLYCRLDFTHSDRSKTSSGQRNDFELHLYLESIKQDSAPGEKLRIVAEVLDGKLANYSARVLDEDGEVSGFPDERSKVSVVLDRVCEFRVPLGLLGASVGDTLRLRFSYWQDGLPIDTLPPEGSIEIKLRSEQDMQAVASQLWKV